MDFEQETLMKPMANCFTGTLASFPGRLISMNDRYPDLLYHIRLTLAAHLCARPISGSWKAHARGCPYHKPRGASEDVAAMVDQDHFRAAVVGGLEAAVEPDVTGFRDVVADDAEQLGVAAGEGEQVRLQGLAIAVAGITK